MKSFTAARYRNDLQHANAFYELAAKILPGNGKCFKKYMRVRDKWLFKMFCKISVILYSVCMLEKFFSVKKQYNLL